MLDVSTYYSKQTILRADYGVALWMKKGCLSELILSESPHKRRVQRELNPEFWRTHDDNQSISFCLLVCRLFLCPRLACIKGAEPSAASVSAFFFSFLCAAYYLPDRFAVRQTTRCLLCPMHLGWGHYFRRTLACPIRPDSIFPQ